jgi:hypothetical protein
MAYALKKNLLSNNLKKIIKRQLFVWENLQIVVYLDIQYICVDMAKTIF